MRTVFIVGLLLVNFSAVVAEDRIERALSFSRRTANKVFRDQIKANWLPGNRSFWYRVQTGPNTHEFVLIDAETGKRKTAKDLKSLGLPDTEPQRTTDATVSQRRTRQNGPESAITFVNTLETEIRLFWLNHEGRRVAYGTVPPGDTHRQHTFAGHVWLIVNHQGTELATIEAEATPRKILVNGPADMPKRDDSRRRRRGTPSPNDRWSAFLEDGVVKLQNRETGDIQHLQTEFDGKSPFRGRVFWAPDSSAFVVSNTEEVDRRQVTIVESSPSDQLQPKLRDLFYPKPGDPLPKPVPVLFRIDESDHQWQAISTHLFSNPFTESDSMTIVWSPDSREFFFNYNERGHQRYRILAANAETGDVRIVVEETADTFIDYRSKTWRHWLHDSGELIWMSERDGWCHLWLYDVQTGEVKNRITNGAWPVREVLHVDEKRREIWFLASGLNASQDPYHLHLCRVKFDGGEFQQLTSADGNHHIEFSPDRQFFMAKWSRVDHPPVHELRKSDDGSLVCQLEEANIDALTESGWTMPERFVAPGRDGKTEIHGFLIKPSDFDSAKTYPVVESIYAGPHSAHVPKDFGQLTGLYRVAELGFVVVKIDGMGTNHRGKAFHDVCWKNLKDAGFPDRIAWIKAAAESRPWMDLSRIGIYGGSAGGQNAMRALLDHHDFYQVAVADCGCHDNRMDKVWWNEQWMGWPIDESYARNSNAVDAHKLKGELLLIVGELDRNVDPASTMQVVGALQKARKRFEFMPIIGAGHGAAETPYGNRLRMEFLTRHLLAP